MSRMKLNSRTISETIDFHDSSMVKIEISSHLNKIVVVLYAPYEGTGLQKGLFYELTFDGVLRLEFETTSIGENGTTPLEIYDVVLIEGEEYRRWKRRLEELANPQKFGHPANCHAEVSSMGYSEIFHVILASSSTRGWGSNEDLFGISIICRSIDINDVTANWASEHRYHPTTIDAK